MIEPKQEDIEKFVDFDVEKFERWLRVALEGLLLDEIGVINFAPIEYCILREHSLSADLRVVYGAFPAQQKAMIREATARLLAHLPVDQEHAPVFREVLDFSAAIQAYEVLKSIPARGEAYLILERDHPDIPSLYSRALETVVELADQSNEAKKCIRRLIGTPRSFACDHARDALVALCKIAPDDFIEHMALLRTPLARNFREFHPTEQALHWLAYDIIKAIGLNAVERDWRLLRVTEESSTDALNDNWFHRAVLLMLAKEPEGGVIYLKESPDVRISPTEEPVVDAIQAEPNVGDALISEDADDARGYPELLDRISDQEVAANQRQMAELMGFPDRSIALTDQGVEP